jgi:hypothetical protein
MRWRQTRCLAALGFATLLNVVSLSHPNDAYLKRFPLATPDAFTRLPRFVPGALPALLVVGGIVLLAGVSRLPALVRRPRAAICGIYLFGVCLHVAFLASRADGVFAMEKRAIASGHVEFLTQGVSVLDLRATLNDYESYLAKYQYLRNKGPGVLVLFRGLSDLANAAPVRYVLEGLAPSPLTLRWWLAEEGIELPTPHMERLRYLLALMLVLFPLLTLLPVFLIFWAGRTFVDDAYGLLAAQLYPLAPAIALQVVNLDFVVFPLCAMGMIVPFAIGVSRRRPRLVVASAAIFVAYFTLTLAALSVLVFLGAYLGLVLLRRSRARETIGSIGVDALRHGSLFVVASILLLVAVCVLLPFDPVARYQDARTMQSGWVTSEFNVSWATGNLIAYFVSLGLMQTVLLLLEQGHSLFRTWRATAGPMDDFALAWLCLVTSLAVFGLQHGETNRMWTFLTPVACLVVGQYLYERLPPQRLWVPLVAALGLLVFVRYHLSYF